MAHFPIPKPFIDNVVNVSTIPHAVKDLTSFSAQDYLAAISFLEQYSKNKATFESYRREIEKLLQWSWLVAERSILTLCRQDIETYIEFCLKPPKSWIGSKRVARFVTRAGERVYNSAWRPFVVSVTKAEHKGGIEPDRGDYHPSQKSIQETFTILGSLYSYLLLEDKVSVNPVALIKQKSKFLQKRQSHSTVMRLTEDQWATCLNVAEALADNEPHRHERTLFILSLLYFLYLRISELVACERWIPEMGHFYQDSNSHWWFKTVGKGNKLREIAVSDSMLAALKRYRKHLHLTLLPSPKEKTPLVAKERGPGPTTSTRRIRQIVQFAFDKAIDKLIELGCPSDAESLGAATAHWLRHTGISDDINKRGRPVAHVRDDAGHSSSAITDRYNDIELTERHRTAKEKH